MRKYLLSAAGVIVVVAAIFFAVINNKQSVSNVGLTVGAMLPRSGDFASIGEESRRGIELAAD